MAAICLVWQFWYDPAMAELGLRPVVLHRPRAETCGRRSAVLAGKRLAVSVGCLYYPPYTAAMDADQAAWHADAGRANADIFDLRHTEWICDGQ